MELNSSVRIPSQTGIIYSSMSQTDDINNVHTHPAVCMVFRTDNILEEICSHLEFNDLKQFRLVSRSCNNEGRRALIKLDRHWLVVNTRNDDWQLELGHVLTNLEKTTFDGGKNFNQKLLGWIFKRLELNSLGNLPLLQQWGHYLRKIHLTPGLDDESPIFSISNFIIEIHNLLTVWCPNIDEMVVDAGNFQSGDLSSVIINQMESLEFPSPLLKLKCLRIHRLWMEFVSAEESEVLQIFLTKLVTAAGPALEAFDIGYDSGWVERRMLKSLSLNVGVSNFQSLKKITLKSAHNVANLSHTVQKCFPELNTLILRDFKSVPNATIRPDSFPALKSLTIVHDISYNDIRNCRILYFLQHFPNLEVLIISSYEGRTDGLPLIPDPIPPLLKSLRSFTFATKDYELPLLRCAVDMFPNLVTLNLLGFGRGDGYEIDEPEYSFGELIDIISPLTRLQDLYVNHAFHTSPQLVDAIQLTANLTDLQTFVLSQAAHNDYTQQVYNVSLYLTTSDPDFQYILDCDCVRRLKFVRLSAFRFGTTEEEVEEEAGAKGGHVSFGPICSCCVYPWKCCQRKRGIPCPHNGRKPIDQA